MDKESSEIADEIQEKGRLDERKAALLKFDKQYALVSISIRIAYFCTKVASVLANGDFKVASRHSPIIELLAPILPRIIPPIPFYLIRQRPQHHFIVVPVLLGIYTCCN